MARVNNQFKVTDIKITSSGKKKIKLSPVYTGEPEFTTGTEVFSNTERQLEILVKDTNNFYLLGSLYYMDFTAV